MVYNAVSRGMFRRMKRRLAKTPLKGKKNNPIGVFDSGIGGLTVLSEITRLLPCEDTVYLGDTARVPYGSKSRDAVIRYSLEDAQFLRRFDVKLVVAACNTASAFALGELERLLDVPVVGVIEPGAKAAINTTRTKRVGIIGTEGTIRSNSYVDALNALADARTINIAEHGKIRHDRYFEIRASALTIFTKACPLFVPLVEEGWLENGVTLAVAREYLSGLKKNSVDALVLGCTHYPLLKKTISKVMGKGVALIDSGEATAGEVRRILEENGLLKPGKTCKPRHRFFVTDSPERFLKVGKMFFGHRLEGARMVSLKEK